jgi:hypothetical protein
MRPRAFQYAAVRTLWLDWTTGRGVTDDGVSVSPKIGERRKNPNLADLLDTAASYGAERIMLTGKVPEAVPGKSHWLLTRTPGWSADGHWLNKPETGRFTNELTGGSLEVRTIEEWFGTLSIKPAQAREAWIVTADALASAFKGAAMALTPARTGTNAWALAFPKTYKGKPYELEPIPSDIAQELHATSGQHRMEHFVAGPDRCGCGACLPLVDPVKTPTLPVFSYVDGRFMYAAMTRELGTGGFQRLRQADAADLLHNEPYARARFEVEFTIPRDWNHVGILAVAHTIAKDGWHYPNRPGTKFTTWADAAEIKIARDNGWAVRPLQAVRFRPGAPMDTFGDKIGRARDRVMANLDLDPVVQRAAAFALRAMLIQTIGNFASRGRTRTETVWSANDVPKQYAHTMERYGDAFTYKVPGRPHDERSPTYRPELAAQIWSRARCRMLVAPVDPALGTLFGGLLSMAPGDIIGVFGDAVYSTDIPWWSLPSGGAGAQPGGDDGRAGRLRLKGILEDVPVPVTIAARNELREQAEIAGLAAAPWLAGAVAL